MTQPADAPKTPAAAPPETGDPTANVPIPGVDAPPAAEPPKPEGEKPAEPKAPETPTESAIARSLRAREAKLVRDQQAFRARMEESERSREARVAAQVEKLLAERLKEADDDPVGFLERRGKTRQHLAERILNDGKKSAEQIAEEAVAKVAALEKQQRDREAADRRASSEREYVALLRKNEEKYAAILDEWDEGEVVAQTYSVLQRLDAKYAAEGKRRPPITDDDLLVYLDGQAKKRQAAREARKQARSAGGSDAKAAGQPAPKANTATGAATKDAKAGATATTLTSRMGAERQTLGTGDALELELSKGPEAAREFILREAEKASAEARNGAGR